MSSRVSTRTWGSSDVLIQNLLTEEKGSGGPLSAVPFEGPVNSVYKNRLTVKGNTNAQRY